MLNRRHLRVKVLQTLYAFHLSEDKDLKSFQKALLKSVDQVNEMYIWALGLISEVSDYAIQDAEGRASKFLPTEKDLNADTKLATNTFVESLRQNEEFSALANKYRVYSVFDQELVRSVFSLLRGSEEYRTYLELEDRSIKAEKDIVKYIFKKLILQNVSVEQVFEERFINWPTDKEVLKALMAKTLKNFSSEDYTKNQLAPISLNWEEDRQFMLDLFNMTVRYGEDYQLYINGKTKNWEAERIALMDTLLMRMAVAELINFSSIPVKVTINEYIEISKEYSTPKSNAFINGILDKIRTELQASGKIRKFGRGLMG